MIFFRHRNIQYIPSVTRSEVSALKFLILTALFIFLPCSESSGGEAEDEYHGVYVVSACKNFDNATALVNKLKAQGYNPFCKTANIPNKKKGLRVFVRMYKSRHEALMAGKELREKGVMKSFIIVETEPGNKRYAPPHTPVLVAKREMDSPKTEEAAPPHKTDEEAAPPHKTDEEAAPPHKTDEEAAPPHKTDKLKFYKINKVKDEKAAPPHKADKEAAPPHKADKEAAPPHKTADIDLKTVEKPYDSAMSDFTSGRYEDALSKFKEIIKTEKNEAVMRRIADCYYFLGEKGDKRHVLEAIDQYRDIIRNYPGSKKENAQAIYRLAKSYSRLNFHYEALMEFKNLYSKYPESDYIAESLYMMGEMYYKARKFNEASATFKEYIKRFPDGKHVRDAYFSVGNCYSQMRQFNDADIWYGSALKKWPALENIPEDTLLKLGAHCFQTGKYDNALGFFFVYLNLFPDGKHCRDTLYKIARSFEAMGQLPLALKALSLVVERYPGSGEARESAVIMANIGIKDPEIKLPAYILPGMDYYRAPIKTYEKMAGKLSDLDMEEELMFRKGGALIKRKKYRQAFDNYCFLLNRFPYGTYRKAGEKKLVFSAGRLIDDLYSKKDYIAVSDVYFNSDKEVLLKNGDFDLLFKIGSSLKEIGLLDHAAGFFGEMISVFGKDRRVSGPLLDMAKIDYDRGCYEDAKKRLKGLHGNVDKRIAIAARKLLGDISYKEGLFKEAAGFYSKVLGSEAGIGDQMSELARRQSGGVRCQMPDIRKKYADSLREMGLYSSALINYKRILKNCSGDAQKCLAPVIIGSYEGAGDCLYNKRKYQQAILMYEQSLKNASEGEQNMWTILNIGQGYANLGNKPMADKSFISLKGESGDEFWSRVADYYTADKDWTEKYGPYIGELRN